MKKIKKSCILYLIVFLFTFFPEVFAYNELKRNFYIREIEEIETSDMKSVSLCDTIINYAWLDNDTTLVCKYLLRKAKCFDENGYLQKSIQTYNTIIHIVDNVKSASDSLLNYQNDAYMRSIKSLQSIELSDLSVEKCYGLLKNQKDPAYLLFAHSFLAIRYAEVEDSVQASLHIHVADSIIHNVSDISPGILSDYYNHKAGVLFFQSKSDSALQYLERGMNHLKEVHNTSYNSIPINLGTVYWKLGEHDLAKKSYRKSASIFKESNPVMYLRMLYYYAGLCYDIQQVDSALYYCKQVITMSDSIREDCEVYGDSRILYSKLLYKMGRYKESRDYYVMGQKHLDSLKDVKSKERLAILQDDMVTKKNSSDLDLTAQKMFWIRLYRSLMLLFLLLWIVVSCLWGKERRSKLKNLQQQSRELEETRCEITRLRERCQSQKAFKEVQSKVLAEALMVYHDTYVQIENKTDALSTVSDPDRMKEMVLDFQKFMSENKEKDILYSFDAYFKSQFGDFIANLQKSDLSLSNNELQICMLLVIDLSTKDIAFYMNKSVRTVETMIYKLRKKFEIPSEMKTPDFFKQFINEENL